MIRLISSHTWSLALQEIRKQKSLARSAEQSRDYWRRLWEDTANKAMARHDDICRLENEVAMLTDERDSLLAELEEVRTTRSAAQEAASRGL